MNLNQITISSTDVARSSKFYSQLGLTMIVDSLPRYARFVCPDGDSTFSISKSESELNHNGVHIYFECDELDKKVQKLKEAGVEFYEDPEDKIWLWRESRLLDPDGYVIILYNAAENRKNPPWRITPKMP